MALKLTDITQLNVATYSSFGTHAVHIRVLIAEKLNYFMTSLRGKNEVQVKFENSMYNYNATLVH